jgi:hypothetical protein
MPDIPVYSYEDLRKKADNFLREHHPSGNIPVPIEEIVEFVFGMNIVPVLGLQREFEVEGFTSGDLKNIYVDEYVYTDRPSRYRFTLAHEIGHVVLHRHLYEMTDGDSFLWQSTGFACPQVAKADPARSPHIHQPSTREHRALGCTDYLCQVLAVETIVDFPKKCGLAAKLSHLPIAAD